jgi:hypothetical protein
VQEGSRFAKLQAKDISKDLSVVSRRRQIYRVMMRRLGDEKERIWDETIVVVLTAVII